MSSLFFILALVSCLDERDIPLNEEEVVDGNVDTGSLIEEEPIGEDTAETGTDSGGGDTGGTETGDDSGTDTGGTETGTDTGGGSDSGSGSDTSSGGDTSSGEPVAPYIVCEDDGTKQNVAIMGDVPSLLLGTVTSIASMCVYDTSLSLASRNCEAYVDATTEHNVQMNRYDIRILVRDASGTWVEFDYSAWTISGDCTMSSDGSYLDFTP